MAAEMGNNRFFRKPNAILWIATVMVILYAVWCVLLLILTASGLLLDSRSFECGNSEDLVDSRLEIWARLVYFWSGFSLMVCMLLLQELWRRNGFYARVSIVAASVLLLNMLLSVGFWEKENQVIKQFEKRYLALLPLADTPGNTLNQTDTICHSLNNVYRWQAEFNCCGLQSYKDWESLIPDSCLCDGLDNSSRCVNHSIFKQAGVGNYSLVYEKPCLPTVLSLVKRRTSTFWVAMTSWIHFTGVPILFFILCIVATLLKLGYWVIHNICVYVWKNSTIGEEMVPVVFIRKDNNNQTEEENRKDREAKESGIDGGVVLDIEDTTSGGV
ncbi:hypothetical protein PFLUV_G00264730 [Perca fluviatilis]|uniref:Tetraspanin n=1 Tax=Perca fluviatilis TaxID=8168 RepID=A0A6A5E0E8_PERFL|nr:hypothetical protein PFLUV_G00264730 [Perca fluviatilis]